MNSQTLVISRTSTAAQSHKTQIQSLHRYCAENNLSVIGVLQINYSAFKTGYADKLCGDIEKYAHNHNLNNIVFWSGDRLCRNIDEFNKLINRLHNIVGNVTIHMVLNQCQIQLETLLNAPYSEESIAVAREIIVSERLSSILSTKMKRSHEIRLQRYKRLASCEKPYLGGRIPYGKVIRERKRSGHLIKVMIDSPEHQDLVDLINYLKTKKQMNNNDLVKLLNNNHIFSKEMVDGKLNNFLWTDHNMARIPFERTIRPPMKYQHFVNTIDTIDAMNHNIIDNHATVLTDQMIGGKAYFMVQYNDGVVCWIPFVDVKPVPI